jgi:hypothetical protein
MAPKRYSIYSSPALEAALSARLDPTAGDDGGGFRSRSSLISAIADRYAEICRRELPTLALNEWLMVFDALNGCWMLDPASLAANGIALEVSDAATLNGTDRKWHVADGQALARRIDGLSFAGKVAILDAAERFWTLDLQPDREPAEECESPDDPHGQWRRAIRGLVGRLSDE